MQEMNFTKGLISVQVKYSKWNIQRYENFFFYHDQLKFNKPSVYTCVCVCVCVYLLYSYCECFFLQLMWTNDSKEEICCKEGCSFQPWVLCCALCYAHLLSCVRLFATPWSPPGFSVQGGSPGKNTGVGCHALRQGIFLTHGSNPGLPHCRCILHQLSHKRSPH